MSKKDPALGRNKSGILFEIPEVAQYADCKKKQTEGNCVNDPTLSSRKSDDDDLLSPTRRESKESNDTFKRHSTESKLSADGSKPKTIGDLYNELYYDSSETEERLRNKDSSSTSKPADASKKSPVKSKTTSSLKDKSNKSEKSPVKSEKPAVKKPAGSEESEDKSSSVASSDESSPVTRFGT